MSRDLDVGEGAAASAAAARSEYLFQSIRRRIALLDYEPGVRLSEDMLATEFGVSRTPVRRVLARLEADGLLEVRHGSGSFVTEIPLVELREVYELKMALFALMDTLSPIEPDASLADEMYAYQKACSGIAEDANPRRRFAEIDLGVFELLMRLVGNRALKRVLESNFYRVSRMWPFLMDESRLSFEATRLHDELAEMVRVLRCRPSRTLGHLHRCHVAMAMLRLEKLS